MYDFSEKKLLIDINDHNFVLIAGEFDDQLNFKIIDKEIIKSKGIKNGKIDNLSESYESLSKGLIALEKKTDLIFKTANVLVDTFDIESINVSGFQTLNGNQILSNDISFILNNLKNKLTQTENHKKIIHLFNANYCLDNNYLENIPIGLRGNLYSHELSFFLINSNDFKSIVHLLNKCNLKPERVLLKKFIEGVQLIQKYKVESFIKINILKNSININLFENSSFIFYQHFKFGSDLIKRDVAKILELKFETIEKIFVNTNFEKVNKDGLLDQKYFEKDKFKQIKLNFILEIILARVSEIVEIILEKNINFNHLKNKKIITFLSFEDVSIANNLNYYFKKFLKHKSVDYPIKNNYHLELMEIFGELIGKGWDKEALPMIIKKKSFISNIFSSLFD